MKNRQGFTLIELLLVIALLGLLAIILLGNFNQTLMRGRDSQRKNDMAQLQRALESYYEDNHTYPTFTSIFGQGLCTTQACAVNDTNYMVKTPNDPNSAYTYLYVPAPTPNPSGPSSSYYMYTYIENTLDKGQNISQKGFTTNAKCGTNIACRYYVSSSGAPQLTPSP